MDREQWVVDFVRSGGFSQFCEAILTRGVFGDGHPEKMVDAQQACLVSDRDELQECILRTSYCRTLAYVE